MTSEQSTPASGPKDHFTLPCYARCTCSGRSVLDRLSIGTGEDFLKVGDLQQKLKPLFMKTFGVRRHPFKVSAALSLKDQDAVVFQDILDLSLAEGYSDVSHSVPCKRLMKKIAKNTGKLPRLFYLQPGRIHDIKRYPSRTRNARFYTAILDGHQVMLKALNLPGEGEDPQLQVDLYRETVIWRHLRHENILPFLGVCVMESEWRLVAPYMSNGDLRKYLRDSNRIGDERLLLLIQQIIEGLHFLHSNGIIHADIKPENVFIDEHERAVVGDIGLAFLNDESYQPTRTASASRAISTGTVRYMAPELLQDKYRRSTEETDIYALGMTIYDILTGYKPFQDMDEVSIMKEVPKKKRPKRVNVSRYGGAIHRDAWELISGCWAHQPGSRPSISEVRERANVLLKPTIKEDGKPNGWLQRLSGLFDKPFIMMARRSYHDSGDGSLRLAAVGDSPAAYVGAGQLSTSTDATMVSRISSEDTFSGADAAIMAAAFREALRKPDFADRPLEEVETDSKTQETTNDLLSKDLAEEGKDIPSITSSRLTWEIAPSEEERGDGNPKIIVTSDEPDERTGTVTKVTSETWDGEGRPPMVQSSSSSTTTRTVTFSTSTRVA